MQHSNQTLLFRIFSVLQGDIFLWGFLCHPEQQRHCAIFSWFVLLCGYYVYSMHEILFKTNSNCKAMWHVSLGHVIWHLSLTLTHATSHVSLSHATSHVSLGYVMWHVSHWHVMWHVCKPCMVSTCNVTSLSLSLTCSVTCLTLICKRDTCFSDMQYNISLADM